MKKLSRVILFTILAPLLAVGAVIPHKPYQPVTDTGTQKASDKSQTLNLNSNDLKLYGPFSLGLQYSHLYGYLVKAQFTQLWMRTNAVSLGLEGGKDQRRINATIAHQFSPQQRIKFSAEHLAQNMEFGFLSGNIHHWVGQNAVGLTYQYLIPHSFIRDINVNAFYSKADSKNLSDLPLKDESDVINKRHIAGGTDQSASIGVDVNPAETNQLGLQLNYDKIHYNTIYEGDKYDASGFGATVTFDQLLTQRSKLSLLVSHRTREKDYKAGVHMLMKSAPGSRLELGVTGERLINGKGLPNDKQFGADVSYAWGGSRTAQQPTYALETSQSMDDLTHWTSQPAVYMPQVLAVKDEKKEKKATPADSATNYTIQVAPEQMVHIDVSKYLPMPMGSNAEYTVAGDAIGHQLQYANGILTGQFKNEDIGKTFAVHVSLPANPNITGRVEPPVTLMLNVKNAVQTPIPNPNCSPQSITIQDETDTYTWYLADYLHPDALLHDPNTRFSSLVLNTDEIHTILDMHGLKEEIKFTPGKEEEATLKIQVKAGAKLEKKGFILPIKGQNLYSETGQWSDPQNISINISTSPVIPPIANKTYKEAQSVASDPLVTSIKAGIHNTFDPATPKADVTVTSDGKSLADFNMDYDVVLKNNNKEADVFLKTLSGQTVTRAAASQLFKVNASNAAKEKADEKTFTLSVEPSTPVVPDISDKTYIENKTVTSDLLVSNISAGDKETFDPAHPKNAITITSDGKSLADFHLDYTVTLKENNTKADVTLSTTDKVVRAAPSQVFVVKATNMGGGQALQKAFTLNVTKALPTLYLECPQTIDDVDAAGYIYASQYAKDTRSNTTYQFHFKSDGTVKPGTQKEQLILHSLSHSDQQYFDNQHYLECNITVYGVDSQGPYPLSDKTFHSLERIPPEIYSQAYYDTPGNIMCRTTHPDDPKNFKDCVLEFHQ